MDWRDDIRTRFPDWGTDKASTHADEIRKSLKIGQAVSGIVIARAQFGVWLDIGVAGPALLLVPNMRPPRALENYHAIGAIVNANINAIGPGGEIGLLECTP